MSTVVVISSDGFHRLRFSDQPSFKLLLANVCHDKVLQHLRVGRKVFFDSHLREYCHITKTQLLIYLLLLIQVHFHASKTHFHMLKSFPYRHIRELKQPWRQRRGWSLVKNEFIFDKWNLWLFKSAWYANVSKNVFKLNMQQWHSIANGNTKN